MRSLRFVALVLFAASVASAQPKGKKPPPPPPAAPAIDPARQQELERQAKAEAWKMRGDNALDAGRPLEALQAYDESWKLLPLPALLYNRARAFEKLGQYPDALEQLERFSREADATLKAKVPKLGELIATYRSKTTRLQLDVEPAGAEIRLGDRVLGTAPLAVLVVNSGPPLTLLISAADHFPSSQQLTLEGGSDVRLKVTLGSKVTESVLRVESDTRGAQATIDPGQTDSRSGAVPLESLVKPGPHVVRLISEGFVPAETTVVVGVGELKVIKTTLSAEPKLFERWYFWAAIGAAVIAGASVGIAWSIERPLSRGTLNTGEPPIAPSFSF